MNKFSYNPVQYADHRLHYPNELFIYLKSLVSTQTVLDCGAGSGQASIGLANHFKFVIAIDLSSELLSQSQKKNNILRIQSAAENLPVRPQSIQLITIAQALHWFSLNLFYKEVHRVLQPNGIIAAWCYNQALIHPVVDKIIHKIYSIVSSAEHLSQERQYLYDHYVTIPFPFRRIPAPQFAITIYWHLFQLLAYLKTWPSILEYEKKTGRNLVFDHQEELKAVWGDPYQSKMIQWPIYLLVGRRGTTPN